MWFNRFDIVEAWWLYLSHTHTGQGSAKYAKMCAISRYYDGKCDKVSKLSNNGQEIYRNLIRGVK